MEIVDLDVDDQRLGEVFRVLVQLRSHLTEDQFRDIYAAGYEQGLRFTGVFENQACTAVAGWRILDSTHTIRKLYVDDLVTDANSRSAGFGRALIAYLANKAREANCTVLDLDSGVQRFDAHRFYLREGMHISSHHFALPL